MAWRPSTIGGETGWSIGQIVAHIGGSRLYFASAYRGEGWIWGKPEADPDDQRTWPSGTWLCCARPPEDWLPRRAEMIDTPGSAIRALPPAHDREARAMYFELGGSVRIPRTRVRRPEATGGAWAQRPTPRYVAVTRSSARSASGVPSNTMVPWSMT